MFIKRTRGGSPKKPIYYLQLIEGFRVNKKVKHKVLATLGREDKLTNSSTLTSLIESLGRYCQDLILTTQSKDVSLNTYLLGPVLIVESMWEQLKLTDLMQKLQSQYKISYDFNKVVKLLVMNRIFAPKSKLGASKWLEKIYFQDSVDLQHMYRSLDILSEVSDQLQQGLYERTLSLFKPEVSIVFYDLTTLYFESQNETGLRKFGYSKENKTDSVQIVLALMINSQKIPIGYEVYPGNTFEGKTVKKAVEKLKKDYAIERVIVVGDKGVSNSITISQLEEERYEYVLAAKLKQFAKDDLLDITKYKDLNEEIKYLETSMANGRRLVLGYSEKKAGRDLQMREKLIEKLRAKVSSNELIKGAYSRYLKVNKQKISINEEAVSEASKWDGYFAFYTNNKDMSPEGVINTYRELWQIEESFRSMKGPLEMRPIYHWTDKRIRGHIGMCYLSFYVYRMIENKLKGKNLKIGEAIDEIMDIRVVEVSASGRKHYVRTDIRDAKNDILRAIGVKIPKLVLS